MKAKVLIMTYRVLPDLTLHHLSDLYSYYSSFASSAPATLAPCCSANNPGVLLPKPSHWLVPISETFCSSCKHLHAYSLISFRALFQVICGLGPL